MNGVHLGGVPPVAGPVVIGGGIAGPVVATALLKVGIQAMVYEAYQSLTEGWCWTANCHILVLPQRGPLLATKQAATICCLSSGRLP